MTTAAAADVVAAGGVLWRGDDDHLEVAVVHRPKYDDWSLPKGKTDPGEQLAVTARREVAEETGHLAWLGRPLGEQTYVVTRAGRQQDKFVRYWSMAADGGAFTPNEEVDELRWLSPAAAARRLSYPRDEGPVRRLAAGPLRTTTVLLVRHARAGDKAQRPAEDLLRPLDETGRRQAQWVRQVASCYGPQRVLSAEPLRCVETVEPLAAELVVPVELEPALGEQACRELPERAVRRLRETAEQGGVAVVCSQGGVIPYLVGTLAEQDGLRLGRVESRKGSIWALSFRGGELVDADYLPDLTPL